MNHKGNHTFNQLIDILCRIFDVNPTHNNILSSITLYDRWEVQTPNFRFKLMASNIQNVFQDLGLAFLLFCIYGTVIHILMKIIVQEDLLKGENVLQNPLHYSEPYFIHIYLGYTVKLCQTQ